LDLVVSDYDLRNAHKKFKKQNLTSASYIGTILDILMEALLISYWGMRYLNLLGE
jgi:hypothetical protein